jgi:predicted alpha-1,2-mannosidase
VQLSNRGRPTLVSAALVAAACAVPAAAAGTGLTAVSARYVSDPTSLVNPFIGTGNGGDTFPGTDVPFGMVQWSPDTSPDRPDGGGYDYDDSAITGYALTHLSGPGCSAEGDVPILPTVGSIGTSPSSTTEPLDHSDETATPGYYKLGAGGITTQLTTTRRSGMAAFAFPASSSANLLFKLSDSQVADTYTRFQVMSDTEVAGSVTSGDFCGRGNKYTLNFDMVFSQPFTGYGTWSGSVVTPGRNSISARLAGPAVRAAELRAAGQAAAAMAAADKPGAPGSPAGRERAAAKMAPRGTGTPDGAYVTFDTTSGHAVQAKVGLSYVSVANAAANRAADNQGWHFGAVENAARASWNAALGTIHVAGGTNGQQVTFYTALYHSLLHPNLVSDVNGQYMGFDAAVHTVATGHAEYANYSGWDIYRSETQLESMLFPRQSSDMVRSMLDDYHQTGMLPKWNENSGETYVMVGDPADPIIADAYAFGARDFDARAALRDMETEATVPGNIRPGLSYYKDDGYLPSDGRYGCCNYYGPVSTQEEYNAADNAIAELAAALHKTSVANVFAARANNWQNVFNPASGFLQPKLENGQFVPGFKPTSHTGFVEADAYIYAAQLPFDLRGLIAAEGGGANWIAFLNRLTANVASMGPGEIQMGNEPSFDIPWEYDYAGVPFQTQAVVRQIQDQLYTNAPGGLAGNDDLGAMSSWYVWSAIGGYPETPGIATVAVGSPMFRSITIHLGDGKVITETAPRASDAAAFVHGLRLNGAPYSRAYLPASLFSQGGSLNWTLAAKPDPSWASAAADAPPSNTSGLLPALGYASIPGQPPGASSITLTTVPGQASNGTGTVTLGVRGMSGSAQQVNWTATVSGPRGLQVNPPSGTFTVAAGTQDSTPVRLRVPSDASGGHATVTFTLTTAGVTLPPVTVGVQVQASP